jgi:hypothetical protein
MKLNKLMLRNMIKEALDDMMGSEGMEGSGDMGASGKVYTEDNIYELKDKAVEELRRIRRTATRGPVPRPSDDEAYRRVGEKFAGIKVKLNRHFGATAGYKEIEATITGVDMSYNELVFTIQYTSPKTGKIVNSEV